MYVISHLPYCTICINYSVCNTLLKNKEYASTLFQLVCCTHFKDRAYCDRLSRPNLVCNIHYFIYSVIYGLLSILCSLQYFLRSIPLTLRCGVQKFERGVPVPTIPAWFLVKVLHVSLMYSYHTINIKLITKESAERPFGQVDS